MRLALISDIHANDVALEAVLADIHHQHIDQVLFLGDLVTLGPQPRPAIERRSGSTMTSATCAASRYPSPTC